MSAINIVDLRTEIIRPTLYNLGLGGTAAEELMIGIALQESGAGRYLKQRSGPARGIWEMEPVTLDDLLYRFLTQKHPDLAKKIYDLLIPGLPPAQQLAGNLYLSCAMARIRLYSRPEPLPVAGDATAQAAYYVKFYNAGGSATEEEYLANWKANIGGPHV